MVRGIAMSGRLNHKITLALILGFFIIFSSQLVFQVPFANGDVESSLIIRPASPKIISLTASDPDGLDALYSNGDVITVTFDKATNRPQAATKTNLQNLFTFSQNLGDDFIGTWTSASVLKISIINKTNNANPTPGLFTVIVKESGNLRNQEGTSLPSTSESPTLTGDFGTREGPSIISLTAIDPKSPAVPGIDAGDIITVRFSENTNKTVNTLLNKATLDALFEYREVGNPVILGNNYEGKFTNARTLKIAILEKDGEPYPTIGGFTLKVKATGRLGDINSLSKPSEAVSPPLSGTFGQASGPAIIDLVAKDPFGKNAGFGQDDTITISFDVPTNRIAGATLQKNEINNLFTFNPPLDSQYNGKWFDSQTFVISFTTIGNVSPQIGSFSVKVNEGADLKNKEGTSKPSTSSSPVLRGTFGIKPGPTITSLVAADPKTTIVMGVDKGDTITVTFNEPTNKPKVSKKADIDKIFDFTQSIGADYYGIWFDAKKLVITINQTSLPPPTVGIFQVTVKASGNLRNQALTSSASTAISPPLSGDFGKKAGPAIISLIAHDPKNTPVPGLDNDDTITVIFSEKTNQPAVATKSNIDALFSFSQSIGDDYTGVWTSTGDLVITIKDGEQLTEPPVVGQLQLIVKATGNLQTQGGSEPSTAVSPLLSGNFGSFVEWVSLCDEGGDASTTFPDGKTAQISFAGTDCGTFEFEVADEGAKKFFNILGDTMRISPTGGIDCSQEPFCTVSFVFRSEDVPDDIKEEEITSKIKILKDVNEDGIINDNPASNEVFNGLTNSTDPNPCMLGIDECVPETLVSKLDSTRYEAKALTPSNSKFAIGGIAALAVGAVGPSPSPSASAPSTSAKAGGAGGGAGGNAASLGEPGGLAGSIDLSQVKLYEATWDKCDKKILRVIAGPAGPGLSVKAVQAVGGIVAMPEASEQPFTKATVYEIPISELETFIRVQVEGVIGREASLAQRSLDLRQCTGGIGGYSETEDASSSPLGIPEGSFPSTAALFEDGSMFDTRYNDIDFTVGYWMPEGQITQMDVDEDSKAITFGFSDKISGRLVLSLPRGMITANDDQFVLLNPATSRQIIYEAIESGSQYVTLEMTLPEEMGSITVVGTNVVPEFGSFVLVILVISIIITIIILKTRQFPMIKLD